MVNVVLTFLLVCAGGVATAKFGHRTEGQRSVMERTLETVVPKNYDPLERPSVRGAATVVRVSVHLAHIEWNFDRLTTVMYLRQIWNDPRLKRRKPPTVLCKPGDVRNHLWFPDTFLSNLIDETKVLNGGFVRVSSDGEIVYSVLIRTTLACPRSPGKRLFAVDGVNECEIALESYSYSADEVALKWSSAEPAATVDDLYNGGVKSVATGEMTVRLTRGSYSRLSVNLTMDTGFNADYLDLALHRFYNRC